MNESLEIMELLHRHLLGATDSAEAERLERELLSSPRLRAEFLRAARMDAVLHEESAKAPLDTVKITIVSPWRRVLVAAAAVAIFAVVMMRFMINPAGKTALPPTVEVATLIDARDCRWADGAAFSVEGRLPQGMLDLKTGVALIEFDGGARMALKGPASLQLTGPNSARLLRGDVTVRCEDGAEGFSLLTPTSTVIDLGTEFGVAVASNGTTKVEVLDGTVEVAGAANQSPATTRVLSAGEAVKLNPDGSGGTGKSESNNWERDYTSKAERDEKFQPPRIFANDSFSTQGIKTALGEYTGGVGWKGPWTLVTQGKRPPSYFSPLLPLPKIHPQSGDSLVLGGRQELRRALTAPIDPMKRQSIYIGFSFSRLDYNKNDNFQRLGMSVLLRSSSEPTSFIAAGLSARNRWSVSDSLSAEPSENEVLGDGPFYVFMRVDFRPKMGNRVSLVAFPATAQIPKQEPTKWDITTRRRMANTPLPFDLIALRTLDPVGIRIGELHVGNSWSAVANSGAAAK